ncbi:winged helix domain-containing protein [Roseibium aggregatum]|uniref:winged helix domain-containing protein n=1 Tax=Roseibium aggregatum TaxID=187304 RepID=UPI001F3F979C|nr:hypothetical protein [Roseibium aggregatum]
MKAPQTLTIKAETALGSLDLTYTGRNAWALSKLIDAGETGCTPIDTPGPRWSGYVHSLRGDGLDIETVTERHGGPFPGCHARYVLRTPVKVISHSEAESEPNG